MTQSTPKACQQQQQAERRLGHILLVQPKKGLMLWSWCRAWICMAVKLPLIQPRHWLKHACLSAGICLFSDCNAEGLSNEAHKDLEQYMQLLDDVNQRCSILQHDLQDYMDAVVHRQGMTQESHHVRNQMQCMQNACSSQEHLVQRLDAACLHPETSITCCIKLCYPLLCAQCQCQPFFS